MTSALVPFTFNNTNLNTVTVNGKHWTRAKEICKALEYKKTTKTANIIRAHCSIENITQKCQLIGVHDHVHQYYGLLTHKKLIFT